jgi:hypothetical protein
MDLCHSSLLTFGIFCPQFNLRVEMSDGDFEALFCPDKHLFNIFTDFFRIQSFRGSIF